MANALPSPVSQGDDQAGAARLPAGSENSDFSDAFIVTRLCDNSSSPDPLSTVTEESFLEMKGATSELTSLWTRVRSRRQRQAKATRKTGTLSRVNSTEMKQQTAATKTAVTLLIIYSVVLTTLVIFREFFSSDVSAGLHPHGALGPGNSVDRLAHIAAAASLHRVIKSSRRDDVAPLQSKHASNNTTVLNGQFSAPHKDVHGVVETGCRRDLYVVPNYIHFVYPNAQDLDPDLPYWVYVNIAVAKDVQKPDRLFFHCEKTPRGKWWDRIKTWVEIHSIRQVTEIFGQPVYHKAHKADIIRMEILLEHGGIYFDTDVLMLRNFDALRVFPFVIGIEENGVGLGNSIMISAPRSKFLTTWYDLYHTFDHTQWDFHSVQLPWLLSQVIPTDILLVPKSGWFYPFGGVKIKLFGSSIYDISEHWGQHLFHNMVKSRLEPEVTGPHYFFSRRNTYTVAIMSLNNTAHPQVMRALTPD